MNSEAELEIAPQWENEKPPRVVAVVVAFNRVGLLRQVLSSLHSQTRPLDAILVVDNASTDGTKEMVASDFSSALYFNTGANLGGAGGFAWGMELAQSLGYDLAWIMDDDAIPVTNALEQSLTNPGNLRPDSGLGFVASIPVDKNHQSQLIAGKPQASIDYERHVEAASHGKIAVSSAAFLGLLINLGRVKNDELPNPDFFIWCDDLEYSTRIARKYGAVCAPGSMIVHESAAMQSAGKAEPLGWKYFYQVRNRIWLARWGLADEGGAVRMTSFMVAVKATRNEFRVGSRKSDVLRMTLRAWSSGLFAKRNHYPTGTLLASSPVAQSWVATTRESSGRA